MPYFVWLYVNVVFQRMLTIQCDSWCAVSPASHNRGTAALRAVSGVEADTLGREAVSEAARPVEASPG